MSFREIRIPGGHVKYAKFLHYANLSLSLNSYLKSPGLVPLILEMEQINERINPRACVAAGIHRARSLANTTTTCISRPCNKSSFGRRDLQFNSRSLALDERENSQFLLFLLTGLHHVFLPSPHLPIVVSRGRVLTKTQHKTCPELGELKLKRIYYIVWTEVTISSRLRRRGTWQGSLRLGGGRDVV